MNIGRIEMVAQFGDYQVYRRLWNEPGLRRYAVYRESDGKCLEEFRAKTTAISWAQMNRRTDAV